MGNCARGTGDTNSKRLEIKELIRELKKKNQYVEGNIFASVENVNLSTVIAYKERGVRHNFLEWYDEWAWEGEEQTEGAPEGDTK